MDLILRSTERMLQTQLSMARRFKLQVLHRYSVKFYQMRKFTLDAPCPNKLKSTGGRRTNILWICILHPSILPLHQWRTCHRSKILNTYKYFLPYLTDCVILRANNYKVAENALPHMLLKHISERA